VFGTIDDGQFTESHPLEPNTPYSASKAGGELQARAHRITYGTPTLITRCGNNFGPYQYPEKLIPFFVTRLIDNKKVPLYGSGQQVRDWVYVMDHCAGIDHVLHHGVLGEAYNIGAEGERTNLEITHRLLQLLAKPESLIKHIGDPRGGAHDRRYSIDATKLQSLGWKPGYDFEEALERTVRWYVDNQAWWRDIVAAPDYQAFVQRFYGPYLGEDL
jgi:dTDP-glucose 4,6-dehydratase